MKSGKKRKYPIPNLPAELKEGIPYSIKSAIRTFYPTPCVNSRPSEGSIRLLRKKVLLGEISREEAGAMLNKDPFLAQGAMKDISSGKEEYKQKSGKMNPQFLEYLMGIPIGWTDVSN